MTQVKRPFAAVILAGDRGPQDPVAGQAGVCSKALVPVAGRSMILWVLDTLAASPSIGARLVCGSSTRLLYREPGLAQLVSEGAVRWLENEPSPSLSARACLETIPADQPVLLTTADHALLTPQMVEDFCVRAAGTGRDVVAALAPAELVMNAFPESRRTITRLRGGSYCGCNLFAFLTHRGRRAALFWRRIEEQRKHPLQIVRTLGVTSMVRYLLGRLTLEQGLEQLSTAMDARAGVVWMTEAEAAVDVDKVADWQLAEKILAARQRST
jgi:GTP:adenosylcobinamide-phosphate guanylyltransferase